VLPFVEIITLDTEDLYKAEKYLVNYGLKPSDAFHIATMEKAGATLIVPEDKDFDKVAMDKKNMAHKPPLLKNRSLPSPVKG